MIVMIICFRQTETAGSTDTFFSRVQGFVASHTYFRKNQPTEIVKPGKHPEKYSDAEEIKTLT